jgi:hypothetical protein
MRSEWSPAFPSRRRPPGTITHFAQRRPALEHDSRLRPDENARVAFPMLVSVFDVSSQRSPSAGAPGSCCLNAQNDRFELLLIDERRQRHHNGQCGDVLPRQRQIASRQTPEPSDPNGEYSPATIVIGADAGALTGVARNR